MCGTVRGNSFMPFTVYTEAGWIADKRAGERVRTVDNDVGNVVLYQLSYARGIRMNAVKTPCGKNHGRTVAKTPAPDETPL